MTSLKLLAGAATIALLAGAPALAADLIVDVPVDAPVAVAEYGWYFSIFGGVQSLGSAEADDGSAAFGQFFDFDADLGWTAGAAVGVQVTDFLRGEVEFSTGGVGLTEVTIDGGVDPFDGDSYDIDDGSASATYLLGNVWFDLDTGTAFTPYIGGGIGAGYLTAEGDIGLGDPIDLEGWGWAYQVGAGVQFDVADNIAVDLGYRYKAIVDADLEGNGDDAVADVSSHVVQAGLKIGF